MIVDPDMPDHWKTRLLADLLGSEADAVLALIRLWAHCQNRKKTVFDRLPKVAVKAICHYQGDPELLDESLSTAGFISRDGDAVTVIGWDEHNSKMIAAWENGKSGGRPKKSDDGGSPENKPTKNPRETQEKPKRNPDAGSANPQESGKGGKGGKGGKDSVPNGTDAAASDPEKPPPKTLEEQIWSVGLETVARLAGEPKAKCRGVIGKWRQKAGDREVLDAIMAAEKQAVSDPFSYITKCLSPKHGPSVRDSFASKTYTGTPDEELPEWARA